MSTDYTEFESKMKKTASVLTEQYDSVRAGKANPAVLDRITVDYYGSPTPIQQIASVSTPDARSLLIQPTEATADNLNAFRLKEKAKAAQIAREKAEAEENAKKLGAIQVKIAAKAGSNGKLFGSVTSKEISDALHEQFDLTIEKQKIVQAEPIKSFGAYEVKCKLGYEVTGTIHVLVIEEK